MTRWLVGFKMAVVLLLFSIPLLAQDTGVPDTVYFGDHGLAYGFSGGVYRIPVYLTCDQAVAGMSVGMEYGLGASGQVYDSIGKFGSVFWNQPYFDLTHGLITNTSSTNPPNPDTLGIGGASMASPLPAGRYKLGDIYFHGASIGSQIEVDSSWFRPSGNFVLLPIGGPVDTYTPRYVGGTLTIVAGPPSFHLISPSSVAGDVGTAINFPVEVTAAYAPATIVIDSIRKTVDGSSPTNAPAASGTNPLSVSWTPSYYEYGSWNAYFTAADAAGNHFHVSVQVTVNYISSPCYEMMGDANCDGTIDVSDAVFIIMYTFSSGPPPGCGARGK